MLFGLSVRPVVAVRAAALARPRACRRGLAGRLLLRGRRVALGAARQGPVPVCRNAGKASANFSHNCSSKDLVA